MIWPRLIVPWKRSEEVKAHHALYCLCVCVDGMLTVAITLASMEAYTKTSSKCGCKMYSALLNFWCEHCDMGFKLITGVSFGVRSTTLMLAANLKPYRREATNQPTAQATLRSFLMDFFKKNSTNLLQQSAIYIYPVYAAFIYRIISLIERLLVKRITTRDRVDHNLIIFIVFSVGNTSKEEEGKAKETWQKVSWNVSLCLCYYACVQSALNFLHRWPLLICSHRVCE